MTVLTTVVARLADADDAIMAALALRSVIRTAGHEPLVRHWPGTLAGLAIIQRLTRTGRRMSALQISSTPEPSGLRQPGDTGHADGRLHVFLTVSRVRTHKQTETRRLLRLLLLRRLPVPADAIPLIRPGNRRAWHEHDHGHPGEADHVPGDVPAVGQEAVEDYSPRHDPATYAPPRG